MNPITIDDFAAFFQELHARDCYSWQRRLADRAVSGNWPGAIDLPTGSGKTACIDVAIFALACQASRPIEQRNAPRRIFFCVNRRVIVDEAFQRARKIAMEILRAEQSSPEDKPTLFRVSQALRAISGIGADDAPPLDVIELRGGIYRDNRWARSVTQPSVICSTIDQIGSRLLFRGYGVSQYAAPIQAALVAYNSLLLLDEAHISEPFRQTANAVRNYLDVEKWADESVGAKPIVFVPMTATPKEVDPDNVIKLDAADRKNESLDQRLTATKCAELCDIPDVAKEAVTRAKSLLKEAPMAVGIIVNRVATAKEIYEKLRSHDDSVHVELVIGSMRPVDRDKQQNRLRELVGPGRPDETQRSSLTIATQCLEVGADYDFDSLITECASLDALRQRFGRLNRSGRPIDAKAVILAAKRAIKPEDKLDDAKPLDPIYDNALARTWNWLKEQEEQSDDKRINFGIDAFDALLKDSEEGRIPENLLAPSALVNAPTMLPAYLDLWCQTSPRPQVEPDVSLFLHGKEAGAPDVQVCWRADLLEKENKQWCDIVSLVPPTSAECMNVPLVRVQQWLTGHPGIGGLACDVPDVEVSDEQHERKPVDPAELKRQAVLWRSGNKSSVIKSVANVQAIRPGDTIVLPTFTKGWDQLGHIPEIDVTNNNDVDEADDRGLATEDLVHIDVAEPAWEAARDRCVLRIHRSLLRRLPTDDTVIRLLELATNSEERVLLSEWRLALGELHNATHDSDAELSCRAGILADESFGLIVEQYPDRKGVVLSSKKRLRQSEWFNPPIEEGDDERSHSPRGEVSLAAHTQHVLNTVTDAWDVLHPSIGRNLFEQAAKFHDLGKADERFQAMLRRSDRTDRWLAWQDNAALLAKSDGMPLTRSESECARVRAELPKGFRHEMLSVQLVANADELPSELIHQSLILHLIASHHGRARPFAPVVNDNDPPDVDVLDHCLSRKERIDCPPHHLRSQIAERFWMLTRRYGWWGLAYLESILRLADQLASAKEDAGGADDAAGAELLEVSK